jgi:hypothetical protein
MFTFIKRIIPFEIVEYYRKGRNNGYGKTE